jgi:hypothetical protein
MRVTYWMGPLRFNRCFLFGCVLTFRLLLGHYDQVIEEV